MMRLLIKGCGEAHPPGEFCPDQLIDYRLAIDEYAIPVRDGGLSGAVIQFCPWCGVRLPESKRKRWFKELEALGFDEPLFNDDIPKAYKSDAWYRNRKTATCPPKGKNGRAKPGARKAR